MILFVRHRPQNRWINFMHDLKELSEFQDNYIPGTKILIGDVSMFTAKMRQRLLKFLEENSQVDCYSSQDLTDPVLLSRFMNIEKEPIQVSVSPSSEDFMNSPRNFIDVLTFIPDCRDIVKLRLSKASNFFVSVAAHV